MGKWFVLDNDQEFKVVTEKESIEYAEAIPLEKFLIKAQESPDASFDNYLYEYRVVGKEIGVEYEDILKVIEGAANILEGIEDKEEVYSELCEYNKLDHYFKEQARELVRSILIDKAVEFMTLAKTLK